MMSCWSENESRSLRSIFRVRLGCEVGQRIMMLEKTRATGDD